MVFQENLVLMIQKRRSLNDSLILISKRTTHFLSLRKGKDTHVLKTRVIYTKGQGKEKDVHYLPFDRGKNPFQ